MVAPKKVSVHNTPAAACGANTRLTALSSQPWMEAGEYGVTPTGWEPWAESQPRWQPLPLCPAVTWGHSLSHVVPPALRRGHTEDLALSAHPV